MSSIPINVLFFTFKCHNMTYPPYDRSISFPTDHLKWTTSCSSTKKIGLINVTNSWACTHKSWVARCSPSTLGFSCNNLINLHGFYRSHSQSSHHKDFPFPAPLSGIVILQINYFKFPCTLACSYEFCAIKVLPHNPYLNFDIVEKNLSKPGFRQRNCNLNTLPHSTLHPPID